MPAGNSLGPRGKFVYTSDNGRTITVKTDATLGQLPQCGLTVGNGSTTRPTGFSFRGVYVQSAGIAAVADPPSEAQPALRKFLICNQDSPLFSVDTPVQVVIDGRTFTSTGRKGESFTF